MALLAGVGALIFLAMQAKPAPQADPSLPTMEELSRSTMVDEERLPTALPPLALPDAGAEVVIIGDSWVDGVDSTPQTDGFAYRTAEAFGWDLTIAPGNGGTGYMAYGQPPFTTGNYATRLGDMDEDRDVELVILAGGINDLKYDSGLVEQGVKDAIKMARVRFPRAEIVVLGVTSPDFPVATTVESRNRLIEFEANAVDAYTVNPVTLGWFLEEGTRDLFTNKGRAANHPNTEGHAVMADLFVEALQELERSGSTA